MDWYFGSLSRWNKFSEARGGATRDQKLWYIWEETWQLIVAAALAFETKWRPSETTRRSNRITLLKHHPRPSLSRQASQVSHQNNTDDSSFSQSVYTTINHHVRPDSSVSTVSWLRAGRPKISKFQPRREAKGFLSSKASRLVLRPPSPSPFPWQHSGLVVELYLHSPVCFHEVAPH